MSVVSVQARDFILALFIRDDGERFLLGDNGYDFKDGQLHFVANSIENDEVAKQGTDGVMLAGQVRRASVQTFEGYVGDATDAKDEIEEKRKAFIAFFAKGHHFRVVYVDCNSNAWQRKGGYLVDAPEVKELWQIHPEYHVGLNFEDVNYYSYNEDAEGDEILANYLNVPVSSDVSGGLEWDAIGAVSEDATTEVIGTTASSTGGTAINLAGSVEAPIVKLDVKGNTAQNGTPTPSAPVPVQTVTGENIIRITGKNLFQVTATSASVSSGVTYTKLSDSSFTIASNGTSSWARADIALPQALELNTTYTFKVNFTSTNTSITSVRASFRTSSAEASVFTLTNGQSAQLSTGSNAITTIRLYITTNTAYSGTVTFSDVQLELGSTPSEYATYQLQDYEVNFDLVHGKNMLDPSTLVDGYISVNGEYNTAHTNGEMRSGMIAVSPSTAYTFSIQATSSTYDPWFGVGEYSAANVASFVQRNTNSGSGVTLITFTTSATTNYIAVSARNLKAATKVQLEQSNSATTYEPWSPLELCKIGDYQDYIWNDNGTWKVHKAIGKHTFTGAENWVRSGRTTSSVFVAGLDVLSLTIKQSTKNQSLMNHFRFVPATSMQIGTFDLYNGSASAQYIALALDATSVPDVTAAKAWITANQPTIYYILTEPTDETITNATLIAQLDALAASYSYNGQTNITDIVATGNSQALLKADYYTSYRLVVTGGGLVWEEGGSGGPTTVINNSIDNVDPVWTVYGPTVNPVLENTTTGEEIEYVGTIADGQTLVIDMGEQTALLNGLNVIGNVTGDYISLAPGQNTLLYTTSSGDDDSAIGWSEIVG